MTDDAVVRTLIPLFQAWGDPMQTETGDAVIDDACTSEDIARVAAKRIAALRTAPAAPEAVSVEATPEQIAAAWRAWHSRHGGKLPPGPAFAEAIKAALLTSTRTEPSQPAQDGRETEEERIIKDELRDYWRQGYAAGIEAAAKVIEGHVIRCNAEGNSLIRRRQGDVMALEYADGIRALLPSTPASHLSATNEETDHG